MYFFPNPRGQEAAFLLYAFNATLPFDGSWNSCLLKSKKFIFERRYLSKAPLWVFSIKSHVSNRVSYWCLNWFPKEGECKRRGGYIPENLTNTSWGILGTHTPPRKLTCHGKIHRLKMYGSYWKWWIFQCHVRFLGCHISWTPHLQHPRIFQFDWGFTISIP